MFRILLDPASEAGAGNPAPPTPAPNTPEPPKAAEPPKPAMLQVPADEVQALYAAKRDLDNFRAAQEAALAAKEQEKLLALAKKGEAEEALKKQGQTYEAKIASLQNVIVGREKAAVLAQALVGAKFADDYAGKHAMDILANRIEAALQPDGSVIVRDKETGVPADQFVKSWLASPAAKCFLAPTTQGGSGATGTAVPGTPPPSDPMAAFAAALKAHEGRYPSMGLRPVS